jgi:hypothetical protein
MVIGRSTDQPLNKHNANPMLHQASQKRKNVLPSCKKLFLLISIFYAGFGYMAAASSNGMKGADGPILAAVFIIKLSAIYVTNCITIGTDQ